MLGSKMKTYSECIKLDSFVDRYRYLKLNGKVGDETFGFDRYLNQVFYRSEEWRNLRKFIIDRDKGCDLGLKGFDIRSKREILIHHINPITLKDIYDRSEKLFDPDNLITTSLGTHNAIHYGDESQLPEYILVDRRPNDVCPWKEQK